MEDTLRVLRKFIIANGLKVLILVVMEDTLRVVSTGREMTVRRVS